MTSAGTLTHQIRELDERLQGYPHRRYESMLAFTACFMSRNVGDQAQARRYAARLKSIAGDDKLLAGKLPQAQADESASELSSTGRSFYSR